MSKLEKYLKRNKVNYELKKVHLKDSYLLFIKVSDINCKIMDYIRKNNQWEYCSNYEQIKVYL